MHLKKLSVLNFKNYEEVNLDIESRITVFVGKNGSGKTNLLDAIYYLSLTKSAFSSSDTHCIRNGESFFMVKGVFEKQSKIYELVTSVQVGLKKMFRENQQDYEKLSAHIGKYPVVLVAPDDSDLVKEGSEARRKFFDSIISQLDARYLDNLIQYNHVLKQRNSLLKMFHESGRVDALALESYDQLLIEFGTYIYNRRISFLQEFHPAFQRYYTFLVDAHEITTVQYVTGLADASFEAGLKSCRQKDLILQRTCFGIHRDDFQFQLNSGELKRFGSQGQQKSFIIALKLAQFDVLENNKGFKPLLLLDDIFDKLDDSRIARLLELIKTSLGQIFITDARPERTTDLLKAIEVPAVVYPVNQGMVGEPAKI